MDGQTGGQTVTTETRLQGEQNMILSWLVGYRALLMTNKMSEIKSYLYVL